MHLLGMLRKACVSLLASMSTCLTADGLEVAGKLQRGTALNTDAALKAQQGDAAHRWLHEPIDQVRSSGRFNGTLASASQSTKVMPAQEHASARWHRRYGKCSHAKKVQVHQVSLSCLILSVKIYNLQSAAASQD